MEVDACGFLDTESLFLLMVPTSKPVQTLINIRMKPWKKEARCYEKELQEEIEKDRLEHGKKPLKEKESTPETINKKGQHYRSRQWLVPQRGTQAGVCLCANTCCDKK